MSTPTALEGHEHERAMSEAMFRGLLEAAPDAIAVMDREGENAQLERLFGYKREELLGHDIEMLVPQRLRGRHPGHRSGFFAEPRGPCANRSLSQPSRVVLLDLKLPTTDGLQALEELKNDPMTRPIPVVILTASREEQDLVHSYRLGVNSYIQKPVDFEQFREPVKQLGLFRLVVNQPPPPAAFQGG